MTDFNDLAAVADAVVMDVLGDKTVTITRAAVPIATNITVIYDSEMQDIDSNGLIQALRPGFTVNKADLSESTLEEGDQIIDGARTWAVLRMLMEDATFITVLVG